MPKLVALLPDGVDHEAAGIDAPRGRLASAGNSGNLGTSPSNLRYVEDAMLIIPAIDLKDGHCVRLKQGIMEGATVFSEDPGAMASHWLAQGARRLHLVDLNGAFAGSPKTSRRSRP